MSEKTFEWKKRYGPTLNERFSELPIPDLWHVTKYFFIIFFIIVLSVPLIILAIVSGAVRLLFAVIIVMITGLLIFAYVSKDSSEPSRWKEGRGKGKNLGIINETAVCVERAMLGMRYSQQVLKERLRNVMFGKLQRKYGLDENQIREYGKDELIELLNDELLVNFLLTPEKQKKRKLWKKRDRAEWKRIENILKEVKSWEISVRDGNLSSFVEKLG